MIQAENLLKQQAERLGYFSKSLTAEQVDRINKQARYTSDRVHRKFRRKLKKGKCFLCGRLLTDFTLEQPCIHWLLRPEGFDKKHAKLVFDKFSYLRVQSWVRWMANTEVFAGNINDLEVEKNQDKIFEYTIRYKNLEWSFSCAESDFVGHRSAFSEDARRPHYHFQMRIDGRPFIDYGNLHIPFTKKDLWHLPITLGMVEKVKFSNYYGVGMQDTLSKIEPERLLASMKRADNEAEATYDLQTLVMAKSGQGILDEDIMEVLKKHKETGVPIATLIRDLDNVEEARTYISPGPGVPEQAGRKSGVKKR